MRKGRKKTRLLPASLVATVAALLMVAGPAFAYVSPQNHIIIGSGSDTTQFVMGSLDNLYNLSAGCEIINPAPTGGDPQRLDIGCRPNLPTTITTENYNHNAIVEYAPLGSGNGKDQLCNITDATHTNPVFIDFARSSSASAGCAGTHNIAYAREGIAWMHWPKAKNGHTAAVTNLTTAQLAGIYTCNANFDTWGQDGLAGIGTVGPVVVFTAQPGSGTRTTWDADLGGITEGLCVKPVTENETAQIYANAAFDSGKGAIVYVSTAGFNYRHLSKAPAGKANKKNLAVLGSVDGVAATAANISNLSYPYGRYVFNQFCSSTCPAAHGATVQAALDYIGVDDIYKTSAGNGFICKLTTEHSADPETGVNYGTEVTNIITANGFVAIPPGATGGDATGNSICREDPA